MITGDSGVGKEVVARLIHVRSRRRAAPFVIINCAGLPETLLESELFGHEKGSFTGAYRDRPGRLELANHGTVFLDEVGEMSLRMQSLLLRFLETGELQRVGGGQVTRKADVRVIVATNRRLDEEVARGSFREDLFYRINVIHLEIEPLRERPEDVLPLARHFLRVFSAQANAAPLEFADDAVAALESYHWPGNVRELRNIMEQILVRRSYGRIGLCDLPEEVLKRDGGRRAEGEPSPEALLARMTQDGESFWSAVFEPFESRDLTRDAVRQVLKLGLAKSRDSYRGLLPLFNLGERDYRRFMRAIRKYDCHLPFQPLVAESDDSADLRSSGFPADGVPQESLV